jgi:hypothetical protein
MVEASVCYRTGPLTDADYDEAIEALEKRTRSNGRQGLPSLP